MNNSKRQNQLIVSCALAPLSLTIFDTAADSGFEPTTGFMLISATAMFLFCGVLNRWARVLISKRCNGNEVHGNHPAANCSATPAATLQGCDDRAKLAQRFLDQGRTAILLRPQIARTLDAAHFKVVQTLFQQETIFVSAGQAVLAEWTFEETDPAPGQIAKQQVEVAAFYLDRFAITNGQFKQFVADGGYGQQALWDAAIWSRVSEFVDRSGTAGPRFWNQGTFLSGTETLPVVGINWYEADAFARWAGRRLPTDAEWVKAAVCPNASMNQDTILKKYPWGDKFDAHRANVWISGPGRPKPAAVSENTRDHEPVHMIGNVWEWTATEAKISSYGRDVNFELPLKSLRGGAFDTYFENQATCQLQSGDSPLARRRNVGFRCCLSATDVIDLGGQA